MPCVQLFCGNYQVKIFLKINSVKSGACGSLQDHTKQKTKLKVKDIFGAPENMNVIQLATYKDVIQHQLFIHLYLKGEGSKEPSVYLIPKSVAYKVQ